MKKNKTNPPKPKKEQGVARQKLIIQWRRLPEINPPYTESYFVKTHEDAMKLVELRNKSAMLKATFEGIDLLK